MIAAWTCPSCEVSGRDEEDQDGYVHCWNCGRVPLVTARIRPTGVQVFPLTRARGRRAAASETEARLPDSAPCFVFSLHLL